jgi:hypothetical protein
MELLAVYHGGDKETDTQRYSIDLCVDGTKANGGRTVWRVVLPKQKRHGS